VRLGEGELIGQRNMNRPHDVRRATRALPDHGISEGDVFMVSTQAVLFCVPDLFRLRLTAGDDAEPGSARRVAVAGLSQNKMGIPDHYDMILAALRIVGERKISRPSAFSPS
jgi:hypothetical protein